VRIGAGDRAFLATTENFNAGWRARLGDRVLEPVRLDGWRQGWVVPSGAGGRVRLLFVPDRTYRLGLVAGAAALVVLLGLALLPARRRQAPPEARAASLGQPVIVAFVVGATILLGGWIAIVVVPVVLLGRRHAAVLAGASFAVAGLVALGQHGSVPGSNAGSFGPIVQALSVLAVAAAVASLTVPPTAPPP
jgi:arabinofuranan 3-O-arabinosyltransferase